MRISQVYPKFAKFCTHKVALVYLPVKPNYITFRFRFKFTFTCYCEKLASTFNDWLKGKKFPNLMKVFKKLDNTSKDNYRPISTLPNFTKLFESIIFTQLNRYMQIKFSKYLKDFWKNHNMHNSLLRVIESWKVGLNNG